MRLPSFTSTTSNNPRQWLVAVVQVLLGAGAVAGLLILTLTADSNAGRQAAGRIAVTTPPDKLSVPVSISTMPRTPRELNSPLLTPPSTGVTIHETPRVSAVTPMEPMTLPDSYQPLQSENYFPASASSSAPKPGPAPDPHAVAKEPGQKPDPKPGQQADANDPAFQRYLEWVRTAEEERDSLRRQGPDLERQLQAEAVPAPASDASPAEAPPTQRRVSEAVSAVEDTLRTTEGRLRRTKPPVPTDCASFDRYYTQALDAERKGVSDLVQAVSSRDTARLNSLRRESTSSVDTLLRSANDELDRAHRARGATTPSPRMQTGDGASLLGELTRPGALK